MAIETGSKQTTSSSLWMRLKPFLEWPWELIPFLFLFSRLYTQTMSPGLSSWQIEGWHSAILQITGSTWGVPYAPSYPLYTLFSNIFARLAGLLPGIAGTSMVWRVTFWSTLTGLLTLVVVYLIVRRLTRHRASALIAGSLLGISVTFWQAAIVAEIYSFNVLIFSLAYWLAIKWSQTPQKRWLLGLGVALGAGLAHHSTALILIPTMALWVAIQHPPAEKKTKYCRSLVCHVLIVAGAMLIPLLAYLYLPWANQYRPETSWLSPAISGWEEWGAVVLGWDIWSQAALPDSFNGWFNALKIVFEQQARQLTAVGVIVGIAGLFSRKKNLWLFGLPLAAFVLWGIAYPAPPIEGILIPLTLILCIGIGLSLAAVYKIAVFHLVRLLRTRDEVFRGRGLITGVRITLSLALLVGAYFLFRPLAQANYHTVDQSDDWQAVDLVEEITAMARAGTPLTIIGQAKSVLPSLVYSKIINQQPVEPLSTERVSRMPETASIALLRNRFEQGRRILADLETIESGAIPWLTEAIESGQIFQAPTGHPFLWELLPRPMSNVLPPQENWQQIPPEQFLDGRLSIIAYNQQPVHKRTGCFLRLTLFWRAEKYIDDDYYVAVQPLGGETVLDKNDHLALMRGYLPTSQMRPGEIVRDEIDLRIRRPTALPGVMLVINLYQVQGDQFPTFGEVTLPITINPQDCK